MQLAELRRLVRSDSIDTVLVAFPGPFGRLVGKRFRADFFLDSVVQHGTHGCSYLLTVNMDMDPLDGFKVTNWDTGFYTHHARLEHESFSNAVTDWEKQRYFEQI